MKSFSDKLLFYSDLLFFQRAITGYNVVYDEYVLKWHNNKILAKWIGRTDIQTNVYQSTGMLRGNHMRGRGRVQIWYPRTLDPKHAYEQGDPSTKRQSAFTNSSTGLSTKKSFSTTHATPFQADDMEGTSFYKPQIPVLVLFLGPVGAGREEPSVLSIQSI